MKKNLICVVLLLAMLAVSGCGGAQENPALSENPVSAESPVPEASPAPEAAAAEELSLVDDSFTFTYTSEGVSGAADHFTQVEFPRLMAEYFENVRYIDSFFLGWFDLINGWICFTGTPKAETGWQQTELNGEQVYCRSINLHSVDGVHWTAEKSFPMEPLRQLVEEDYIQGGAPEYSVEIVSYEKRVMGLCSAELYVSDLGERYTLTDPSALRALEKALIPIEGAEPQPALSKDCAHCDPIYLTFSDGSSALALTGGDGSNAVNVWGKWERYNTNQSIYELFGVERQAAGYSRDAEGFTTTSIIAREYDYRPGNEEDYEPTEILWEYVYDANGCRVSKSHRVVSVDPRRLETVGTDELRTEYEFDSQGHEIEKRVYLDNELVETVTSEYDAEGLLIKQITSFPGGGGCFYTYDYDEQGRLTASIYHFADGQEGRANHFYWYDENGGRHEYALDESGSPITADGQPVRRG